MNTIDIYCNYGVLAAEKRNVYTFGAPHYTATCSDKMTVAIPNGWKIIPQSGGTDIGNVPLGMGL